MNYIQYFQNSVMKKLRTVREPKDISLRKRSHRQDMVTTFISTFISENNFNLFIIVPESRRGIIRNMLWDGT